MKPSTRVMSLALAAMLMASVFVIVGLIMLPTYPNHSASAGAYPGTNGKIAFQRNSYTIYVENPDGTDRRFLTSNGSYNPSWSPDAKKIAFTSIRDGNQEIYVMNANGSSQTRLTSNSVPDSGPTWSPDGKKIAFTHNYDIYVMNADGSNQTPLMTNSANDYEPSWSPDGKKIAFTTDRDGLAKVYLMNSDGSGQDALSGLGFASPNWSPDAKKIAFVEGAQNDIYVINVNGTGLTKLTNSPGRDAFPSWSPDGTKIAFASDRDLVPMPDGGFCYCRFQIYTMNADGTNQRRVSNTTTEDSQPSWGVRIPAGDIFSPDTTITSASYQNGKELTNGQRISQPKVSFAFNGEDNIGISGFECKIDSDPFSPCTSPANYKVSIGEHAFSVRAIDVSGNTDPTPATFTWIRGK